MSKPLIKEALQATSLGGRAMERAGSGQSCDGLGVEKVALPGWAGRLACRFGAVFSLEQQRLEGEHQNQASFHELAENVTFPALRIISGCVSLVHNQARLTLRAFDNPKVGC